MTNFERLKSELTEREFWEAMIQSGYAPCGGYCTKIDSCKEYKGSRGCKKTFIKMANEDVQDD